MLLDQPMETCHQCGAEADGEMDGKAWCASCLHIEGSCCADDESDVGQVSQVSEVDETGADK